MPSAARERPCAPRGSMSGPHAPALPPRAPGERTRLGRERRERRPAALSALVAGGRLYTGLSQVEDAPSAWPGGDPGYPIEPVSRAASKLGRRSRTSTRRSRPARAHSTSGRRRAASRRSCSTAARASSPSTRPSRRAARGPLGADRLPRLRRDLAPRARPAPRPHHLRRRLPPG